MNHTIATVLGEMPWVLYIPLGVMAGGLALVALLVWRDKSDGKGRW
ncbi:hypothetical protein RAS1_27860 [Phycisphaerae bacterium RAS1]|nr:hypothetical protein RAS1_27860 [Phycisphaerae bacterium RAS1]